MYYLDGEYFDSIEYVSWSDARVYFNIELLLFPVYLSLLDNDY